MKLRFLAILMIATLVLGLAACGGSPSQQPTGGSGSPSGGNASGDEPVGDLAPYQLDYILLSGSASEEKEKVEAAINEIIQPLLNATIVFKMVDWASWEERANTAVQAGEKADIIFTADWYSYMRNISLGMFTKLNDPEGPNGDLLNTYGKGAVETLGQGFILGTQVDGVNYGVPTNKELTVPEGYVFNLDLVEKYGFDITEIHAAKDLTPWLEIVKAGEGADFYPYVTGGDWCIELIEVAQNVSQAVMYNDARADGTDDPNIYFRWETPEEQAHMHLLRDWYQAGYIHPDSYLTSYSKDDNFNAGVWFVARMPLKGNNAKSDELMSASGNADLRVVEQQIQTARQITVHAGGSMLAIPVTSKDPVRAMMYINLMHTNVELLNTMVWGVEGVHYTKDANNIVTVNQDNNWNGKHGGNWTMGNQFIQYVSSNENPDKFRLLKEFSATGTPHISLGFRFRNEVVDNEIASMKNVTDGPERALKTGSVDPDVEIPKMIDGLKAAGVEKVLEEVRSQFTAWQATK